MKENEINKIINDFDNLFKKQIDDVVRLSRRQGALKMLKFISKDMGWEESEEYYLNKVNEILNNNK